MNKDQPKMKNRACPCKSSCPRRTSCEKCQAFHHAKSSKTYCGK